MHSPAHYDAHGAPRAYGDEAQTHERMLDAAQVALGDRVLDIGCGTGTLAIAAARRVGDRGAIVGVDASAEMIDFARTKALRAAAPVTFERALAQALPFPDAQFDVVLCALALHHVSDAERPQALAEQRRVLVPGGRVLIVERAPSIDVLAAALRAGGFSEVTFVELGVALLGCVRARR